MRVFLLLIALTVSGCALAQSIGGMSGIVNSSGGVGSPPSGKAQLNLGQSELQPANFINILKVSNIGFSGGATPANIGDDEYPFASFTGLITLTFGGSVWTGVTYILSWPATRTFTMTFLGTNTGCVGVNATISGCAGGNMTVSTQGTAGSVTWTPSTFTIQFAGASTYSVGSGDVTLMRTSDATLFSAGEVYTPEFIAAINGLGAEAIRPMGWVYPGLLSNEVKWAYRAVTTTLSWTAKRFPTNAWGGTVSGTDAYTIAAATDTPLSGWVANEAIQGLLRMRQHK